ncbi:hypothetical protein [Nonomuraea sp. NPDC049141]|uniref:protein kinase domain-containing protein n=1 Tax=Nonomuraea sp. NPDC049141 TaxID=3155500 RepID=UPI003404AD00
MTDGPLEEITDLGYIIGEETGWPTLEEEIRSRGPLTGAELQRLAVTTMTGLAALHQAGVFHGAVRADTVLLGPNGPRLRHPVQGGRDPLGLDEATVDAGTLTWSTPEELKGLPAAQPADMFGWGATMAFAATGQSPFGGGSATARVNRLLHGAADLGLLEGALRDLVADCLAAEQADRPTATDALLRLIGYSGVLDVALPAAPPEAPARRLRSRVLVLSAAGLAIALVSGGVTYLATQDRPVPRPTMAAAATPAVSAPTVASTPAAASTGPVPRATKHIALPSGGTLYENPADPIKLASYAAGGEKHETASYVRVPDSDKFERVDGQNISASVSPDGRWLATLNDFYFPVSDHQDVVVTERRTGARFTLPVAATPDIARNPYWSRDSRRLLLTVIPNWQQNKSARTGGFVVLDIMARTSTFVPTSEPEPSERDPVSPTYHWTPDGNGVAGHYLTPEALLGVRFRDLAGHVTRTMHWVGHPIGEEWFSPTGRLFVTTSCRHGPTCVWDTATGARRHSVPSSVHDFTIGWYDEAHLINGAWSGKNTFRLYITDFTGKQVRVLADITGTGGQILSLNFIRS